MCLYYNNVSTIFPCKDKIKHGLTATNSRKIKLMNVECYSAALVSSLCFEVNEIIQVPQADIYFPARSAACRGRSCAGPQTMFDIFLKVTMFANANEEVRSLEIRSRGLRAPCREAPPRCFSWFL